MLRLAGCFWCRMHVSLTVQSRCVLDPKTGSASLSCHRRRTRCKREARRSEFRTMKFSAENGTSNKGWSAPNPCTVALVVREHSRDQGQDVCLRHQSGWYYHQCYGEKRYCVLAFQCRHVRLEILKRSIPPPTLRRREEFCAYISVVAHSFGDTKASDTTTNVMERRRLIYVHLSGGMFIWRSQSG